METTISYGFGFTVSGSVSHGRIGTVITKDGPDIINPRGAWTIQQITADYSVSIRNGYSDLIKIANPPGDDGPSVFFRIIKGNRFEFTDFPGPYKSNDQGTLTFYSGQWDFDIRLTNGKEQCEVKFHVDMSLRNGKWETHWHSR